MKPCPECKEEQVLKVNPAKPNVLELWEAHKRGCSHSPLVTPAVGMWNMRDIERTDTPQPIEGKGR